MSDIDSEINNSINESLRVMGITKKDEVEEEKEKTIELKREGTDEKVEMTEEKYLSLINHSYAVSSLPLIKLLKLTTGIDYTNFLFNNGNVLKKSAEIEFRKVDEKKQYALYLDIVNSDYNLNFGKYGEIKETKEALVTQCLKLITFAQFLFNHIRDKNKELLEYHLIVDDNSTLYLDSTLKKRIGIRFEARKYTEPEQHQQ